jgi:hypothetical protein
LSLVDRHAKTLTIRKSDFLAFNNNSTPPKGVYHTAYDIQAEEFIAHLTDGGSKGHAF